MSQAFFYERQAIPYVWRLSITAGMILMVGFIFLMVYLTEWDTMLQDEKWSLLSLLSMPVVMFFVFMIKLDLRIDETAIEYKLLPFQRKYKKILFADTSEIKFARAKTLRSLKGLGHHQSINRSEYNFGGKYVLEVRSRKGKVLAFSTSKPRELEHFLRNLPEEVPVIITDDRTSA